MRKKRKQSANGGASSNGEAADPTSIATGPVATSLKQAIAGWKVDAEAAAKQADAKAKAQAQAQAQAKAGKASGSKSADVAKTGALRPPVTMPPPGPSRATPVTLPPLPDRNAARKLSTEDQNAMERAFAGVRPLTERKRGGPSATVVQATAAARGHEADARARLDALVGGTSSIRVERLDEEVTGLRDGVAKQALRRLRGASTRPEATLDLHGERASDVASLVSKFVRMQHKKGLRLLLIIHGKGHHSEAGIGVLADKVVATLSEGGAAPLVSAFATAHAEQGGSGALMVELVS